MFFENFAHENSFDPLVADNWYAQPREKMLALKVPFSSPLRSLIVNRFDGRGRVVLYTTIRIVWQTL